LRITNKFNVPETLVSLAANDDYTKGLADFSVTEIISPPRIQRLRRKHWQDMEQDVSDMLWSMLGRALHVVAEKGQTDNHIVEERLHVEVSNVVLSGAIDLQKVTPQGILITDYKFTSAWAVKADKFDWEAQQNIYAWMVREKKGVEVLGVQICALIRDWSRRDAAVKFDYPPAPIQVIDLPLWDHEKTQKYVEERIALHKESKFLADMDEELPFCTEEERWVRTSTYAVKREGRKTAIRVFETKEEAEELAKKENGYVEFRRGEPVRCTGNFCGVSQWCSQYRSESDAGDEKGGVRAEGREE
jgi:hypothetical protein